MCEQCGQEHSVKAAHWIGNYLKKKKKRKIETKKKNGGEEKQQINHAVSNEDEDVD